MILEIKKMIYDVLDTHLQSKNLESQSIIYEFLIEIPQNTIFGHLSTNVLMVYGKKVPNKISFQEDLLKALKSLSYIEEIQIIHPGFLNFFLKPIVIENFSYEYIKSIGNKENISIEYASPNPTGPCHLGHSRGSIIGEILVNLHKYLGYNVRKDCIFNDGGNQVNAFIKSIFINYQMLREEKFINIEDIIYKGNYIKNLANNIYIKDNSIYTFENFKIKYQVEILEVMKNKMIEDLNLLDIQHDIITYESKLKEEKDICWNILKEKNLIILEDTQKGTKFLFNSTYFADDKDRVIEREDGSITYFGNDIAYHLKKKNLLDKENHKEFYNQIIVLGDDHIGYLKRLSNAVKNFNINLRIVTHNLVKIFKDNQEVKMSKRDGNFITIKDFLQSNSKNLLKILMIEVGYNSVINIDLNNLVIKNTLLNNIENVNLFLINLLKDYNLIKNNINSSKTFQEDINKDYKQLISYLVYWPEFVLKCQKNLEVHLILLYLENICKVLYNIKNNNLEQNFKKLEMWILYKTNILIKDIKNILTI